jgi:hypothetical protein
MVIQPERFEKLRFLLCDTILSPYGQHVTVMMALVVVRDLATDTRRQVGHGQA